MKNILRDRDGSVLLVAVVVVMILAGLCTALLIVSGAQSKATVISEENIRIIEENNMLENILIDPIITPIKISKFSINYVNQKLLC